MRTFKLIEIEKMGGFHSIEVIRVTDVISCPIILNGSNLNAFKYRTGYDDEVEIMPVGESIIISAKPRKKDSGLEYAIKSKFEVLYPTAEIDELFNEYTNGKVIIKGRKYDGTAMLYGSLHFPLDLTYEHKHSKKLEVPTKMIVTIDSKIPQKPVFMSTW